LSTSHSQEKLFCPTFLRNGFSFTPNPLHQHSHSRSCHNHSHSRAKQTPSLAELSSLKTINKSMSAIQGGFQHTNTHEKRKLVRRKKRWKKNSRVQFVHARMHAHGWIEYNLAVRSRYAWKMDSHSIIAIADYFRQQLNASMCVTGRTAPSPNLLSYCCVTNLLPGGPGASPLLPPPDLSTSSSKFSAIHVVYSKHHATRMPTLPSIYSRCMIACCLLP
jgi:hypothetical protein